MRALFLLLLLANLAFFAWWRTLSPPEVVTDAAPLKRQIEPEKLKIIAPADLPPAVPSAPAAPAKPSPVAAPVVATRCMEWGSFTLTDAPRAQKALEPLALGPRLAQRRTEETAGWWVFIPPQANRAAAQKKAAELKDLGVDDYFIVLEEGAHRWALSLGVFRTEEAAAARLAALRAQKVRSAVIGPRETVVPKIWLQVRSVDAALEAKLKEIALQIDGSELKSCP
jgi:sporulation related protein